MKTEAMHKGVEFLEKDCMPEMHCGDVAVPGGEFVLVYEEASDLAFQIDPNLNILEGKLGVFMRWANVMQMVFPSLFVHAYTLVGFGRGMA